MGEKTLTDLDMRSRELDSIREEAEKAGVGAIIEQQKNLLGPDFDSKVDKSIVKGMTDEAAQVGDLLKKPQKAQKLLLLPTDDLVKDLDRRMVNPGPVKKTRNKA